MARSTSATNMPSAMPSSRSISGLTYTGTAPQITRELMALMWTFRGRMILSPFLQVLMTIACTAEVVPFTIKNACSAPNAWAARSSASRITETGWQRLSSGFMEFTSTERHFSPRNAVSSGFPLPRLWPGTSNGTSRIFRTRSRALRMGVSAWDNLLSNFRSF